MTDRTRPTFPGQSITNSTLPTPLPVLDASLRPQNCRICGEQITTARQWLSDFGGMYHVDCHEKARAGKHLRVVPGGRL